MFSIKPARTYRPTSPTYSPSSPTYTAEELAQKKAEEAFYERRKRSRSPADSEEEEEEEERELDDSDDEWALTSAIVSAARTIDMLSDGIPTPVKTTSYRKRFASFSDN